MSGTKKAPSKPSVLKTGRLHSTATTSQVSRSDVPEATIRKLSEILKSTDLAEIEIKTYKMRVRVLAREAVMPAVPTTVLSSLPASGPVTKVAAPTSQDLSPDHHIIRSPFIGTFYRSPSPTSAP